jgi:cholesterol oxidase
MPMTAHFLGGCAMGASPSQGVVDPWHRVYGCPGLHVVDGSAVPANPGANPALTITAMAERAFSYWPNKGEPDPRPVLGEPLGAQAGNNDWCSMSPLAVATVPARSPIVPAGAVGALQLADGRPR